jgi:AcrR family transcriptional regulator
MDNAPSRRERKKAQTRAVLVEVALRLIAERGIYGTRVEDITEKSDLGKGAFYNYFPSKSALVAELVAQGVDTLCEEYLVGAIAPGQGRIAAVIHGHEAFFAEHPVFVVLFHQARGLRKIGSDDDLQPVFVDYLGRIGDMLVGPDELERASKKERMDLAAVILGSIAGYRSFRIAAGLDVETNMLASILSSGVESALAPRIGRSTAV